MRLEFAGDDCPLGPDDVLETFDAVRRGDTVWFDRLGSGRVAIRVLPEGTPAHFPHRTWRIDRGAEPGMLVLSPVTSPEHDDGGA
jgi:hypothetical protein